MPHQSPETQSTLRRDLVVALRWSWVIFTAASLLILLTPLVVDAATLSEVVGVCPAKAAGQPCALCGMTTAFFLISDGQLAEALLANAGSVPLYAGLVVNAVVTAARWFVRS